MIAVLPLLGAFFLLFTHTDLGRRQLKARVAFLIQETMDALPQEDQVLEALTGDPCGTDDLCRYLNRSGCFPL